MSSALTPYLLFHGDAREAVTFYQSVFGGELGIMTFADMGATGDRAEGVMHANLVSPHGVHLMASDLPPGEEVADLGTTGRVNLALSGEDGDRLRGWFDALAEGGEVTMALAPQPWGDEYGEVIDRFGMRWMTNISLPGGTGRGEPAESPEQG